MREDVAATLLWRLGMDLDSIRPRLIGQPLTLPLPPDILDDLDYGLSPCDEPLIDSTTEANLFVWQDCLTDVWNVRATAGGSPTPVSYTGTITSDQPMFGLVPVRLELGDMLEFVSETEIRFELNVMSRGKDGFQFRFPAGANVCLGKHSLETLEGKLGVEKVTIPIPFNLTGLSSCYFR